MILPLQMFKMNSDLLKKTVSSLSKSARKTQAKDPHVYVKTTAEGMVSFYFQNVQLSAERIVAAEVQADLAMTTSLYMLDTMVSGLPYNEEIQLQIVGQLLEMRWGNRKSKISVPLHSELLALNEPPINDETVVWQPGTLHGIVKLLAPFCLVHNDPIAKDKPALRGIQFSKEDGEVYLRASGTSQFITRIGKMDWFDNVPAFSLDVSVLQSISEVIAPDTVITVGRSKHGNITFKTGSVTCITSPLQATLNLDTVKHIEKLVKEEYENHIYVDRLEIIELMKRVRTVTQVSKSYVIFEFNDQKITCHTAGRELIQDVTGTFIGTAKSIALSATQLELAALSFFQNKGTGELIIGFPSYNRPVIVKYDGETRTKVMITPITLTEVKRLNEGTPSSVPVTV